ncbi:MAG: septum formation initiator family protein [Verrucomicrobia bacterium]|nr:septum formation initiator family protein [Verrucomicrobiota bacterium]
MNYWAIIYRFAIVVLVVLLAVGVSLMLLPPTREIGQFHKRQVSLTQENEQLEAQIRELVEKQARFRTDPAFVQRTAREAGMVKSNEVIYRLEDSPPSR